MKLLSTLAGLCVFALAASPAVAQHGGFSAGGSHSGGGGSHAGSSGGHSSGGSSAGHFSVGSSHSGGSSGGSAVYSGGRGSSGSYTYPGTGTHETGFRGNTASHEFTNNGGIRFSDFGVQDTPRFSASMIPPRPGATPRRQTFQVADSAERSQHDRRDHDGDGSFDRGDRASRRFPHTGFVFFGAFGTPFCDPFGWTAYDQSFLSANAFGCFGNEWTIGNGLAPDADSDQPSEYEYSAPDDEDTAASPDDSAAPREADEAQPPVTLLQLKDGSMYGLSAYWVEGGELHYVTDYGGANQIPLDRIDLAKTVQLNASHGQAFVLAEKLSPNNAAQ